MKDKQSDWDKAEFLCSQNKYTDALHCLLILTRICPTKIVIWDMWLFHF